MLKRLLKSKVFWTGIAGIFTAIGTMISGDITVTAGLIIIFEALLVIFFRDTFAKINNG